MERDVSNFIRNRYLKEYLLNEFTKIDSIEKVFYSNLTEDNELEIHVNEEISKEILKDIIAEIQTFDNYVQDFCEFSSKRSNNDDKAYMVDLSWIKIEPNKVVMGYWGSRVNIELRAIFVKNKLGWKNEKIYWQ